MTELKFKVGDEVAFIEDHGSHKKGDRFKVELVSLRKNAGENSLLVLNDGSGVYGKRLKLVEKPPFKIGDRVKINELGMSELSRAKTASLGGVYTIKEICESDAITSFNHKAYAMFEEDVGGVWLDYLEKIEESTKRVMKTTIDSEYEAVEVSYRLWKEVAGMQRTDYARGSHFSFKKKILNAIGYDHINQSCPLCEYYQKSGPLRHEDCKDCVLTNSDCCQCSQDQSTFQNWAKTQIGSEKFIVYSRQIRNAIGKRYFEMAKERFPGGSSVRVVNCDGADWESHKLRIGQIGRLLPYDDAPRIRFADDSTLYIFEYWNLEPVAEEKTKQEFKVGDKVVLVRDLERKSAAPNSLCGRRGTIIGLPSHTGRFAVETEADNHHPWYIHPDNMMLLKSTDGEAVGIKFADLEEGDFVRSKEWAVFEYLRNPFFKCVIPGSLGIWCEGDLTAGKVYSFHENATHMKLLKKVVYDEEKIVMKKINAINAIRASQSSMLDRDKIVSELPFLIAKLKGEPKNPRVVRKLDGDNGPPSLADAIVSIMNDINVGFDYKGYTNIVLAKDRCGDLRYVGRDKNDLKKIIMTDTNDDGLPCCEDLEVVDKGLYGEDIVAKTIKENRERIKKFIGE